MTEQENFAGVTHQVDAKTLSHANKSSDNSISAPDSLWFVVAITFLLWWVPGAVLTTLWLKSMKKSYLFLPLLSVFIIYTISIGSMIYFSHWEHQSRYIAYIANLVSCLVLGIIHYRQTSEWEYINPGGKYRRKIIDVLWIILALIWQYLMFHFIVFFWALIILIKTSTV